MAFRSMARLAGWTGLLLLAGAGAASAQGSTQWSRCASENEPCYIPYATTVAYGANGVWARRRFNGPGTVNCANRTFGDPLVGVGKVCYFRVQATPPAGLPRAQWSRCAGENQRCVIPYTTTVAYGANGVWARRRFNGPGTVNCTNGTFGDPLVGVGKVCYFRVNP